MNKSIHFIIILLALFCLCVLILWQCEVHNEAYSSIILSLILENHTFPRIGMALACGALLSVASLLLQYISHNPLASDSTFGIAPGAGLALFACTLLFPMLSSSFKIPIAFLGGILSMSFLLLLSVRNHFSILSTTLSGLILGLFFSSLISLLTLLYPNESLFIHIWFNGDLTQDNPYDLLLILLYASPALCLLIILAPSLSLLVLGEDTAKSIGANVSFLRAIGMIISSYLIALAVSFVGIIGFIGFICATIVQQQSTFKSFLSKMIFAILIGALFLGVIDALLQIILALTQINIPTGSVTSLMGIPLMLWFAFRKVKEMFDQGQTYGTPHKHKRFLFLALTVLLILSCIISLSVNYISYEWKIDFEFANIHFSRMLVAASSGIILSGFGVILQRLSQNPMASPELLGINSGISLGILFAIFFAPDLSLLMGLIGACIVAMLIFLINIKGVSPQKIILTGIAIMAFATSLEKAILALGDMRIYSFLAYTQGSTYWTTSNEAILFFIIALIAIFLSLLSSRVLHILSLGITGAISVGMNVILTRVVLLLFCIIMSTIVCLHIGPMSFVGLLAPHIAFSLGLHKPHLQLIGAMMIGAIIMILSDFLGRNLIYPYEIPAGLIASLLGSLYFIFLARKH